MDPGSRDWQCVDLIGRETTCRSSGRAGTPTSDVGAGRGSTLKSFPRKSQIDTLRP